MGANSGAEKKKLSRDRYLQSIFGGVPGHQKLKIPDSKESGAFAFRQLPFEKPGDSLFKRCDRPAGIGGGRMHGVEMGGAVDAHPFVGDSGGMHGARQGALQGFHMGQVVGATDQQNGRRIAGSARAKGQCGGRQDTGQRHDSAHVGILRIGCQQRGIGTCGKTADGEPARIDAKRRGIAMNPFDGLADIVDGCLQCIERFVAVTSAHDSFEFPASNRPSGG